MSFNKRHFSQKSVREAAKNHSFESFRAYLLKPDLCYFEEESVHQIWKTFQQGESLEMQRIYENLKHA